MAKDPNLEDSAMVPLPEDADTAGESVGEDNKWEEPPLPNDDFSDTVEAEGDDADDADDGNGKAKSSYFIFALLGLAAILGSGFVYYKFAPSSSKGDVSDSMTVSQTASAASGADVGIADVSVGAEKILSLPTVSPMDAQTAQAPDAAAGLAVMPAVQDAAAKAVDSAGVAKSGNDAQIGAVPFAAAPQDNASSVSLPQIPVTPDVAVGSAAAAAASPPMLPDGNLPVVAAPSLPQEQPKADAPHGHAADVPVAAGVSPVASPTVSAAPSAPPVQDSLVAAPSAPPANDGAIAAVSQEPVSPSSVAPVPGVEKPVSAEAVSSVIAPAPVLTPASAVEKPAVSGGDVAVSSAPDAAQTGKNPAASAVPVGVEAVEVKKSVAPADAQRDEKSAAKAPDAVPSAQPEKAEPVSARPAVGAVVAMPAKPIAEQKKKPAQSTAARTVSKPAKHVAKEKKPVENKKLALAKPVKPVSSSSEKSQTPQAPSYRLRSVALGQAWIEDMKTPGLLRTVTVGDTVPGLGKIKTISATREGWAVIGSAGTLR